MIKELYEIIVSVYKSMNREFEIPLEEINEETPLRSLGIDSLTFVMIMLQIEQQYSVNLAADPNRVFEKVSDVLFAIEAERT